MGAFAIQLAIARGDALAVGKVFVRMIILTTLLTIILGISFNQRTWCIICPMGTMAHYVAKIKVLKAKFKHVNFRKNTCINCRICSKSCPMEIDVFNYKKLGKVIDANCIKCNGCVEKCPKKSLFIA